MTKNELKAFILRQLGHPFHQVELTNEQLDDCIQMAVDRFTERHYDAVIENVYALQLSSDQNAYTLPNSIKSVIDILPGNAIFSSMSETEKLLIPFTGEPFHDFLYRWTDITSIMTFRMCMKNWEEMIGNQSIQYSFNYSMHKLIIQGSDNISKLIGDNGNNGLIFLRVYECDDDSVEDIYENRVLKSLCAAYSKKQWAMNLGKFDGQNLPGGAGLRVDAILSEANDEIQKIEEFLEDEGVLPCGMLIG